MDLVMLMDTFLKFLLRVFSVLRLPEYYLNIKYSWFKFGFSGSKSWPVKGSIPHFHSAVHNHPVTLIFV
jgi:hypothetical protein